MFLKTVLTFLVVGALSVNAMTIPVARSPAPEPESQELEAWMLRRDLSYELFSREPEAWAEWAGYTAKREPSPGRKMPGLPNPHKREPSPGRKMPGLPNPHKREPSPGKNGVPAPGVPKFDHGKGPKSKREPSPGKNGVPAPGVPKFDHGKGPKSKREPSPGKAPGLPNPYVSVGGKPPPGTKSLVDPLPTGVGKPK